MSVEDRAMARGEAAELRDLALAYLPAQDGTGRDMRLWIPAGSIRRIPLESEAFKSRLLAAVLDFKLQKDVRLILCGTEIGPLPAAERAALRARVAYLPANGGLISNLNGWENIVLPLGYHDPKRLRGLAPRVYGMLEELGASPRSLLAKLPEEMTLYEKKAAGYVRILLEAPQLVLTEDLAGGLEGSERRQAMGFATAYRASCPDGTMVQLEDAPDA
jgi:ABC-type transporter Mla maintaining outer membrane lipid asymmetry ATPase subunit MlaF